MELEFRTKDGVKVMSFKGNIGYGFYEVVSKSHFFEKQTKTFTNKTTSTCFVATDHCKFNITNDIEIWFEPKDYMKVVL